MAKFIQNKRIRNRLENQVKRKIGRGYRFLVIKEIEIIKNKHIQLFMDHEITRSMLNRSDEAGLLTAAKLKDLPAFLGVADSQVRSDIQEILKLYNGVIAKFTDARRTVVSFRYLNLPSPQDIFDVTHSPWKSGASWAKQVERGVSGLGMFIKTSQGNEASSRTGRALQARKNVRAGKKVQKAYITSLLNNFYNDLSKVITSLRIEKI